jgi:membrane protein YdbS with pleckstrin-like domain
MKTITSNPSRTKQCPFCAETILAAAIKCRFCGEFLDGRRVQRAAVNSLSRPQNQEVSDEILFRSKPSLWARAGSITRRLALLFIAGLLLYFPLESIANGLLGLDLSESQILTAGQYRFFAGTGLAVIAGLLLLISIIRLKAICYEITEDRIEWSRGILSRKFDNLDMYRVVDLKLHRNLFDCIVGVGTLSLITTDKTDPEFVFEKTRNIRKLYNVIKKASLEAAQKSSVVHMENK